MFLKLNLIVHFLESKYTALTTSTVLCSSSLFTYGKELFEFTEGFHTGHGIFIYGLMTALKSVAGLITNSRALMGVKHELRS